MSLEKYSMTMPRTVYSGKDALENLKTIVKDAKKVAIFTDRGILSTGLVDLPLAKLQEAGKETIVISDLPPEPTYMQVQKLVDEFKASGADFIVAVGGGSAMDTAKLASLLATERYTVKDLLDDPTLAVKTVKICLIPTTAGTGSEATPNVIVAVPEQELKIGIVNSSMVPDYVVLDAEMIRKLPRKIAAATGIDAMAHAIECFTSNKANPFSDIFALEAFDLIMNNIETACDDPDAHKAFEVEQKVCLLVGLGTIGKIVAHLCQGLDMKVIAYDSFLTKEQMAELGVEKYDDKFEALGAADVVVVQMPLIEGVTNNTIAMAELKAMKPTALLINCGRGGLVNEPDLCAALKAGEIAGAGLDVFWNEPTRTDDEILHCPNVIVSPHSAAQTREAVIKMATMCVEGCLAVCDGKKWPYVADKKVYDHPRWAGKEWAEV